MITDRTNLIPLVFSSWFNDPEIRKAAALVSKKLEEGNICYNINDPGISGDDKIDIRVLESSEFVTTDPVNNIQPMVLHSGKLYLHRYFSYETIIIEKIRKLLESGNNQKTEMHQTLLNNREIIEKFLSFKPKNSEDQAKYIPWQKIAAISSFISNFHIITGGPGTGKTSAVAAFIMLYLSIFPWKSIALAAPTGKAAARMNESISSAVASFHDLDTELKASIGKIEARTIHRLLEFQNDSVDFKRNNKNLLQYDLIIIDESSMIDAPLMAKLLDAVCDESKLIMIGDRHQLSPIGAGSIFGDLCKINDSTNCFENSDIQFLNSFITTDELKIPVENTSGASPKFSSFVTELKHVFRFSSENQIFKFSNRLMSENSPDEKFILKFKGDHTDDLNIIDNIDNTLFCEFLKYYEEYASEPDIAIALEKLSQIRILCAVREGEKGVFHFNDLIEKHLKNSGLLAPSYGFYDKQPVIITTNDYNLRLFNGDTGVIRMDHEKKRYFAFFIDSEGELRQIPAMSLPSHETVFAMTIHKSQGSEFRNVILILPDDDTYGMLTRELLYTGITRAKHKVLIISSDEMLINAGKRSVNRISGIGDRLMNN